jgi:hypothetical protein
MDPFERYVKGKFGHLAGKTIVSVKKMSRTDKEAVGIGFDEDVPILELSDGSRLFPLRDAEGNGPGALGTIEP